MTTVDRAYCVARRDEYLAAEIKLAEPGVQSYSIGSVQFQKMQIEEIRNAINFWQAQINKFDVAASGGSNSHASRNPGVSLARVR